MADQRHFAGARPAAGWRASEIPAAKGLPSLQAVGNTRTAATKKRK